jgi:predicted RNA-binding Zn ribbon-like protein
MRSDHPNCTHPDGTHPDWTQLKRVGGQLCLDFINTVDRTANGFSGEWLMQYADLVSWSRNGQILTDEQAKSLLKQAEQHPDQAQTAFAQMLDLRERLYRIFAAIAAQQPPNPSDLAQFNRDIAEMHQQARLVYSNQRFVWGWTDWNQLESPLWRIVQAAAELITDDRLQRVRECAGSDCGWVFLDTSRNRSRRWCDMEDCGNRAKAQRHYQRSKKS